MKKHTLLCDWGTTSFRLRLIDTQNYQLISEVVSLEGVAATFQAWKATSATTQDKQQFFIETLKKPIARLANQTHRTLHGTDIILSGMASSSMGMVEIPYATLPFDLDGKTANIHKIEADDTFPHTITLISGVRSADDVMRGEETQLVGLSHLLQLSAQVSYVLIFPGTHSKHLYLENNCLVGFKTYMTGEMFHIIAHHSILKDSIDTASLASFSHQEQEAFKMGVLASDSTSLLHGLFKVRTNQLFQTLNKRENALYLSGLLIGSEIKNLMDKGHSKLGLCSGNNLYPFYKMAMAALNLLEHTLLVSAEMVEKATLVGQMTIAQNQALT